MRSSNNNNNSSISSRWKRKRLRDCAHTTYAQHTLTHTHTVWDVVCILEAPSCLVALSNLRCEHSNEKCFPVSSSFLHLTRPVKTTTITRKCRYQSRIIKGRQYGVRWRGVAGTRLCSVPLTAFSSSPRLCCCFSCCCSLCWIFLWRYIISYFLR